MKTEISVIVPAYNEARLIEGTVRALLRARREFQSRLGLGAELIVVDNGSQDGTRRVLAPFVKRGEIRLERCSPLGAARARNIGASAATGEALIFVDADTWIDPNALLLVWQKLQEKEGRVAGVGRLERLDGGLRAYAWWRFWGLVRLLPLARAKAMPALMFCSRTAYDELGPFDEGVGIGEEWPILAGAYRRNPHSVVYEGRLRGRTSSRRMELQPLGYLRTLSKWVWAVCALRGRIHYSTRIR